MKRWATKQAQARMSAEVSLQPETQMKTAQYAFPHSLSRGKVQASPLLQS